MRSAANIRLADIEGHASKEDCWLSIEGKVRCGQPASGASRRPAGPTPTIATTEAQMRRKWVQKGVKFWSVSICQKMLRYCTVV